MQTILDAMFDRIVVISLARSVERREHIRRHFRDVGITRYEFHDAFAPGAPETQALYARGQVAAYPPCFRCGKTECGKPNCNNVLIPAQVAVFATYLGLWQRLAATGERVLVCEDDVSFHPWAARVFTAVRDRISSGTLVLAADAPGLLRLGWGLNAEHADTDEVLIDRRERMSNPCHALTSAYAQALLDSFRGVTHTADVYQHRLAAPAKHHAWTVFPPVASELSWSTGQFDSLIHPRQVFAQRLEAEGRFADAEVYRAQISRHYATLAHKSPDNRDVN